ncbi:hypothetical protein B738_09666 [Photorhabdus temperata subsp. temperata M1021]|nr:hypothetical protein B738_09666 [Photorhabdus temperata subsp. temperata M1021]
MSDRHKKIAWDVVYKAISERGYTRRFVPNRTKIAANSAHPPYGYIHQEKKSLKTSISLFLHYHLFRTLSYALRMMKKYTQLMTGYLNTIE